MESAKTYYTATLCGKTVEGTKEVICEKLGCDLIDFEYALKKRKALNGWVIKQNKAKGGAWTDKEREDFTRKWNAMRAKFGKGEK